MSFANEEIAQIVQTICQSVLGIDAVTPIELRSIPAPTVAACIHIGGGWQGTMVLACSHEFARQAAAKMFQINAADCTEVELQDAVAELVNMIGGNLKALIVSDSPCQLSLPAVVAGSSYSARVTGAEPVNQLAIDCDGATVAITVMQRVAQSEAA